MFEDAMKKKTKTPWTVMVSFGLQCLLVLIMVLIPLLDYYEIPLTELSTFLVSSTSSPS